MAKTRTQSTLLTVDDLAAELDIEELDVFRLIALGRLIGSPKETDTDKKPDYRFATADLESFATDPLFDLRVPLGRDRDLATNYDLEKRVTMAFRSAVMPTISNADILKELDRQADRTGRQNKTVSFQIPTPPPVFVADLDKPVRQSPMSVGFDGLTTREGFIRNRARKAFIAMGRTRFSGLAYPRLIELYRDPSTHSGLVRDVRTELQRQTIRARFTRRLEGDNDQPIFVDVFATLGLRAAVTQLEFEAFVADAF